MHNRLGIHNVDSAQCCGRWISWQRLVGEIGAWSSLGVVNVVRERFNVGCLGEMGGDIGRGLDGESGAGRRRSMTATAALSDQ